MTVQDVYKIVDAFAPFSTQEKWDNSGLLVGSPQQEVTGVLLCLDISDNAVEFAAENGCNLLISHHPVIFSPLKHLPVESPVYQLARHGMAAICCHTPLDAAKGGINDALVKLLGEQIPLTADAEPLEDSGVGRVVHLHAPVSPAELAGIAKSVLCCTSVRLYDAGKVVQTLGICSGSGSSMLEEIAGRCDAFLTGDVKHDRWYKAEELGISLLDCGHYETEIIALEILHELLQTHAPELPVTIWKGGAICRYV